MVSITIISNILIIKIKFTVLEQTKMENIISQRNPEDENSVLDEGCENC
jgi:hypothetical protein